MPKYLVSIVAAGVALASVCGASVAAAPPPNGGTISIEPKTGDTEYDPAMPAFVNAAADALAAKGFTILEDPGHSAYVLELVLRRVDVGTATAKVPTGGSAMLPGGAGASVGAGIVIPFSTGQSTLVPLQRTQLDMRIRKRGAPDVVWKGAAVTVRPAGTRKGAPDAVAADLSQAALRNYPADGGEPIGVP